MTDQCPSTTKGEKRQPSKHERSSEPRELQRVAGRRAWRSLEEHADRPEFREFVEREFPSGASELLASSRRTFLQLMGASLALAGAATLPGCRRPEHNILPYSRQVPEDVIPGKPLYYATSMPLSGGGAEGLLVETHEGRPTKIEGNPLHPINRGRSSNWSQAAILNLYDPDRMTTSTYNNAARGRVECTWEDFLAHPERPGESWTSKVQTLGEGEGLVFLVDKVTSPTRDSVKARVLARFPKAAWLAYSSVDNASAIAGTAIAFGAPQREVYDFTKAAVVLSLDRDFLNNSGGCPEAAGVAHQRMFAAGRKFLETKDAQGRPVSMNRLYVFESGCTSTGSQADHRFRVAPSRIPAVAYAIAARLGDASLAQAAGDVPLGGLDADAIAAVADDLIAHKGSCVVLAGPSQPPEVHALVAAMNAVLGNVGTTVRYIPMSADEGADSLANLTLLAERLASGSVDTLVCVNTNPLYDAPASLGLATHFAKARLTITLATHNTETALASTWALAGAHFLESWGDVEATDGTISPVQPMIAPLFAFAKTDIEFLAMLAAGDGTQPDGYALVRESWRRELRDAFVMEDRLDADRLWRRSLHDGVAPPVRQRSAPSIRQDAVLSAVSSFRPQPGPTGAGLDVVFDVGLVHDGRYANNPWLQELPHAGTRVVWDNPALMSPKTAQALRVAPPGFSDGNPDRVYTRQQIPTAQIAEITLNGRKLSIPVWILPGMADDTIILTLGYGRRSVGVVGDGVGFDTNQLRGPGAWRSARGATVAPGRLADGSSRHEIASTQNHWSMEGRTSIVRSVDLAAWHKHGDMNPQSKDKIYGATAGELNFAEQLGELSHTPPNISIYENPFNRSRVNPDPTRFDPDKPDHRGQPTPPRYSVGPQWGMSIDMTTCTGCGTCTIACQAENNIPVVGKKEVAKGREMTWIRVDRYYTGDDVNNPELMLHQPVACVHCENAPCEVVCPVNATVHGPEGLNYMTYNRCIGTRYCANNCPYKVRRFNFFDYGVTKFNGSYMGQEALESVLPDTGGITGSGTHNKINPNLIPPRLREKLDEISKMQKNPDVTVRSRGVMEKCSYCIQRINAAKIECKLQDLKGVPDGFFQTACQQACPSNAIVFGDILDETSKIAAERRSGKTYLLLGYLNTRPRTTYLANVRNPNPRIRKPVEDPFHHGGAHGEGHHSGEGEMDHGGHGEGDLNKAQPAQEKGHSFFDPRRKLEDPGYALSLNTLSVGARA
ncbi:MAG: TAT-variant-translocated molybdopterin oxidoreductase [Planctomycetota bacterium]|nr:TAT-variant-translocated molybdopterin oxidoreductase [Planctomycetota bacterium]